MIRSLSPLAACLFAFCVQGAYGQASVPVKLPKLVLLGGSTQELGKIPGYGKQTAPFRLKNAGAAPAKILRIIPSCSCLTGRADKTLLQPQEEAVITLVLDGAMVHGVFKRSLWVETDDPSLPRFPLSLGGSVLPLFHGLPESPQQFVLAEGASWTNRFTLSAAEKNLFLGKPALSTDTNKLRATVTLSANTQTNTSFDITLVVTALAPGRHSLFLSLPVEGRPNLRPIKIVYFTRVGSELKAVPANILLSPSEQPLTRSVHVMTSDKAMATNALTWSPQREGVSVSVQPTLKGTGVMVTLTLSPEAVAKLLEEKNARMTFLYPNVQSASINFLSRQKPPPKPASAATGK